MQSSNQPQPAAPAAVDQVALLQAWNRMFGGRRNRRKAYRRWLKANNVPRPVFNRVSEERQFNLLNMLTFMDDIRKAVTGKDDEPKKGTPL